MAFTIGRSNRTVLIGIPEAPRFFFNVTRPHGIYIVGYSVYSGSRASIAPDLQRSISNRIFVGATIEEFITGILAVILISLFAEIIQTILLRTNNDTIARNGLRTAYLLDEFSHLRNLWNQTTRRRRRVGIGTQPRSPNMFRSIFKQQSVALSLFVLVVACVIFVADVMAIYATRPRFFVTTEDQFNLRGVQPVGTTEAISSRVRFLTQERPCILPKGMFEIQEKHFRLSGCVEYNEGTRTPDENELPDSVTLESFYHVGGSDHNVSFGTTWYSVSTRAMVYLERDNSMRRILYNRSVFWERDTRYLHNVTMFYSMQVACNKRKSKLNCEEIVEALDFQRDQVVEKNITIWERQGVPINVTATGLSSVYRIELFQPEIAYRRGMQMMTASSAVLEVTDKPGWYEDESGVRTTGIAGLMTETGRHAGLYMLGIMVASCGAFLLILRLLLDPKSLAEMAMLRQHSIEKARFRRRERRAKKAKRYAVTDGDGAGVDVDAEPIAAEPLPIASRNYRRRAALRGELEESSLGTEMYEDLYRREYDDDSLR